MSVHALVWQLAAHSATGGWELGPQLDASAEIMTRKLLMHQILMSRAASELAPQQGPVISCLQPSGTSSVWIDVAHDQIWSQGQIKNLIPALQSLRAMLNFTLVSAERVR